MANRREQPADAPSPPSKTSHFGRIVLDILLGIAVVYMVGLNLAAALDSANARNDLQLLESEAHALYEAFAAYNERNHGYPSTHSESAFDIESLDPLNSRGYYRGPLTSHVRNRRVDAYDSPDDLGVNREFWVEMTLRSDPSIRILVARSDDAPMAGGAWRDGVFVFRDSEIEAP